MMSKIIKGLILIMTLLSLLTGCIFNNPKTETGEYRVRNIRIYKNTPAWKLAKAVNRQDTKKIAQIVEENPEVLNFQDPLYGATLLYWAVGMEKYKSAKALLEAGADPNIITHEMGTALYRAAGYSFVDTQAKKDPMYVRLLLKYGADPNIGYVNNYNNTDVKTPLMESIGCGIEKTKALVEAGADINYRTEKGMTAAIWAIWVAGGARTNIETELEVMEYAHYLIIEKKADVTKPYLGRVTGEEVAPVSFLRDWFMKLDDKGYQRKMEIVEEFARQGADYWSTEITKHQLNQIQKLYPDTWEEYIKRY